jgi:plastocyanin
MRFLLPAFGAAALLALAVPAAATPAPVTIKVANFTFAAPVVTVAPGTAVTWVNEDDIPHTIVADDKAFRSKVLDTGERFTFTFTTPGAYGYFCSIHPHMTGKVVVKTP